MTEVPTMGGIRIIRAFPYQCGKSEYHYVGHTGQFSKFKVRVRNESRGMTFRFYSQFIDR